MKTVIIVHASLTKNVPNRTGYRVEKKTRTTYYVSDDETYVKGLFTERMLKENPGFCIEDIHTLEVSRDHIEMAYNSGIEPKVEE